MDKNELIVNQQIEIEQLKLKIKDIKLNLKPVLNSAIFLQQHSISNESFPKMGMNLSVQCSHALSDIVHEN